MDVNFFLFWSVPLVLGWILDKLLGDPMWLPHPVVGFGKVIAKGEKILNKGNSRFFKGLLFVLFLILATFLITYFLIKGISSLNIIVAYIFNTLMVFFCLAGNTLIQEVKEVFKAVEISVEDGRKQVARIVGRDTSSLNSQEIRTAALETLAENLSDGVVAPLFWYMLLGVPGMLTYKMINTLDSMIGYKSERYKQFGFAAARIDDFANFIPARLTAFLMLLVNGCFHLFSFLKKYGRQHASPNSGYPEAALAGILNCQFGGPNVYFGEKVDKPYIGHTSKTLTLEDMYKGVSTNIKVEVCMIGLVIIWISMVSLIVG